MAGQIKKGQRQGAQLVQWLRVFGHAAQGNVAMMFAMVLPLLLMLSLGAVDIHQASRVKANLQDALDAAALAAGRSNFSDAINLQRVGMDSLKGNMPGYFKDGGEDTATFALSNNVLVASAKVNVKVLVANIVLPPYGKLLDDFLPVGARSEVVRASRNVEVALALDITESMKGTPLADLKLAAKDLIDIVVQDQQDPFYSKLGLVPYGASVNMGAKAEAARGPIATPIKPIQNMEVYSTSKPITAITRGGSAWVSVTGHGLSNGAAIVITDVSGMTDINDKVYYVVDRETNRFRLSASPNSTSKVSTRGYSNYSGGGLVRFCIRTDCKTVVTSASHQFKNTDYVWVDDVLGRLPVNKSESQVTVINGNSVALDLPHSRLPYTGGGNLYCTNSGCQAFRFQNANNSYTILGISTCVSERVDSQKYTNASVTSAYVGRVYPSPNAGCPESEVTPLSQSRASLKADVEALKVSGTTAGQIGLAWAWYMVSETFRDFWTGASAPGLKDPAETLKVVVLMTDGEFNTPYCTGVVGADAGFASYIGNANIAKCKGTNGTPFEQSVKLCEGMRADGVIVYTVGFNLENVPQSKAGGKVDTAYELLEFCATDKAIHFHNAKTGADLRSAFSAIGRDITRLRLAR